MDRVIIGGRYTRHLALAGAACFALLVALPAFTGRALIEDLIFVFYMLALAQYWNLLAGYAGLISVGQQAFVGLGGYMLFALTVSIPLGVKRATASVSSVTLSRSSVGRKSSETMIRLQPTG